MIFFLMLDLRTKPFERTIYAREGHGVDELAQKLEMNKHEMLNEYFQPKVWHKFTCSSCKCPLLNQTH